MISLPLKKLLNDIGIDLNDQSDASIKDWFEYTYELRKLGGYDDIFFNVNVKDKDEDHQNRIITICSDWTWIENEFETVKRNTMTDILENLNVAQVNRDIIINDVKELHENLWGPLPKEDSPERDMMRNNFIQKDAEYPEAVIPTG